MERLKNFFMNKKGMAIIAGVIVILIVVLVLLFMSKDNTKLDLEATLKDMGIDFYENFYYDKAGDSDEERASVLQKYKEIGIKINLDNLQRYNSEQNAQNIKKFVNPKTKEQCNFDDTMVIIYPKENYGKKDYDIKVSIVCGLEDK